MSADRRYHDLDEGRYHVETRFESTVEEADRVAKSSATIRYFKETPIIVKDKITDTKYIIEKEGESDKRFTTLQSTKRLLMQVRLGEVCTHPNIHCISHVMLPDPSSTSFEAIYLVKPFMDVNLVGLLHQSKQVLSIDHARYIMWQLLCGLNYLHSAGVIHHEISPRNILLNATCDVCITDIPLYVEDEPDEDIVPHHYYYKSPEVIICVDEPTQPRQSMWTAGCILADILNNKMGSLYEGGYFQDISACGHFKKLVSVIGRPSDNELLSEDYFIKNKGAKDFIKSLPQRATSVTMEELCPKFSHEKDAEDLLLRMLCIDPRRRISVKEALEHPFFADYYDPQSPDVQDAGTSITLENVMIPEDDVEKAWEDQYPYCIRVGWEHDRAKAVWWRHFYQRDSSLPVEYPGRAEFKADMNWVNRKSFLMFLYHHGFAFLKSDSIPMEGEVPSPTEC